MEELLSRAEGYFARSAEDTAESQDLLGQSFSLQIAIPETAETEETQVN